MCVVFNLVLVGMNIVVIVEQERQGRFPRWNYFAVGACLMSAFVSYLFSIKIN